MKRSFQFFPVSQQNSTENIFFLKAKKKLSEEFLLWLVVVFYIIKLNVGQDMYFIFHQNDLQSSEEFVNG